MAETAAKSQTQNGEVYVSISFLKKNPDLSPEQFYEHWEKVHGALVKPWAQKHGFISYKQVCMSPCVAATCPIKDFT